VLADLGRSISVRLLCSVIGGPSTVRGVPSRHPGRHSRRVGHGFASICPGGFVGLSPTVAAAAVVAALPSSAVDLPAVVGNPLRASVAASPFIVVATDGAALVTGPLRPSGGVADTVSVAAVAVVEASFGFDVG